MTLTFMDAQRLTLLINYHLREGFISKLQVFCSQALAVRTNDHVALLWRAVGLLLESKTAEVEHTPLRFNKTYRAAVPACNVTETAALLLYRLSGSFSHCCILLKLVLQPKLP